MCALILDVEIWLIGAITAKKEPLVLECHPCYDDILEGCTP